MIKYHPQDSLIQSHAKGELPASMSIAVAAHCEMCETCQGKLASLEKQLADEHFNESIHDDDITHNEEYADILKKILRTPQDTNTSHIPSASTKIVVVGDTFTLPKALSRFQHIPWNSFSTISRARLPLNEGDTRASLLHIGLNGSVATHTHKGIELTLLLSGEFEDEYDTYHPGDFVILNKEHQHSPKTKNGCLCYTVSDAPLHFVKGMSQLLNSFGRFIY